MAVDCHLGKSYLQARGEHVAGFGCEVILVFDWNIMPPKKHLPTTGELIYKQVGRKQRFKMVSVPKRAGPSSHQAEVALQAVSPSIAPPQDEYLDGGLPDVGPLDGQDVEVPKRTGKVSQLRICK